MKKIILLFMFCFNLFAVVAHEGHDKKIFITENLPVEETIQLGRPTTWLQWVGSFHLIFIHFPITLINMLAVSEILFIMFNKPIFELSSRFLVISAAVLAPPTALLGLIYSYSAPYEGIMETFLWWHMWRGIATAIVAVITAVIKEYMGYSQLYYVNLVLLFLLVNIAGFFGAGMTFGPYHLNPPL